jgi:ATP-dependent DNA helicase RecG
MPEQQNIEWKESWRDEYLKWICGFANAQGGKLYIGCDDTGKVVGVSNSKKLLEDIPNKIRDAMGIVVDVNRLTEGEKEYIEIDVPPYPIGISCKGVYHYRSGSTKQVLTGPALEAFLMRKHGATWDHSPLPVFKAEEVDDQIVEHFKKLAAAKGRIDPALLNEPKEVLMEKLRLTNGDYLTNAAMLLFCKDPDKYQLGSYIKIGYFESDSELLYQDEVHGSILEQVDKAIELIYFKYMRAKITYEGIYRRERYFVPEAALREALLNAICHKQYESRIPIQVSVYDDRLYVANVGRLPENWTLENLMGKHASLPYNPDIAHIFYLAGFIESWGRGIEKICDSLKADNLPMPEYTVHPGDIMIKFTGPEDRIVRVNNKVNDRVNVHVNDRESALLNYLAQDPGYTVTQLAEMMNVSRKTIAGYLKALKDKGVIERIGTTRTGYWKIK